MAVAAPLAPDAPPAPDPVRALGVELVEALLDPPPLDPQPASMVATRQTSSNRRSWLGEDGWTGTLQSVQAGARQPSRPTVAPPHPAFPALCM
jgi:hypothetical protein